ncbi:MAG: PspC domain-containing protein [Chloroflexota bacterium]|nr:PspC domain-containing protein [Chloroflexota bacterium]
MNRRLYKSPTERVMSGVAGGVAEYLDTDPSIVRVVWALLAIITGGVFLVLYIVMWIVVPEGTLSSGKPADGADPVTGQPADASASTWSAQPARRARRDSGGGSWVVGLILIGLGGYFLAREYFPAVDLERLWPLGLVVLGLLLLFAAMRRRPS